MNGMKGIVHEWIYPIIIFVVMTSQTFSGDVYILPGYDLDEDGFGEFILINQESNPAVRYIELTKKLNHVELWSKSLNELPFELNHIELISGADSATSFLVLSGTSLTIAAKNKFIPLEGYWWIDSTFSDSGIALVSGPLNGDRFRSGHVSYSAELNLAAVTVNSPSRNVLVYQPGSHSTDFSLVNKIDSLSMKNGLGKIMCEWFGPMNNPLLAVFSIESDSVIVDVFESGSWEGPAYSSSFSVPSSPLVSYSVLSRDLSEDGFSDVVLPFANDDIYTLSIEDSAVTFLKSDLSQTGLFSLPDPATESDINSLLEAQVKAGLIDSDFLMFFESGFPDSIQLAFIDTISVGDTISIAAAPDSSAGFYSFRWTRRQPQSAYFDPLSGFIKWIPRDKDIGHHIFSYLYEVRISESLFADMDEFGDRHQIVPVLASGDSTWGMVVIDSTKFIPPPVIYPQFPQKIFSLSVSTNEYDSTEFNFKGVASYQLSTEIFPGRTGLYHSISTNIEALPHKDEISFSYASSSSSSDGKTTLSLIHDLNSNVLSVALDPALDSLPQTFYPGDWNQNLSAFPEFLFHGFKQDIVMDSSEKSIVFHGEGKEFQTDLFVQWIEVISPSRPDHVMRILFNEGSLHQIKGTVRFREDGSATTVAEFSFSEEFYPIQMMSNLIHSDEDSIRTRIIPAIKLEDRTSSDDSENPENQENSEVSDS